MKNFLFDSLFLVNLSVFSWDFCVLENIPCKATYSVKIGVWNDSKTMWDSLQTLALMQKTCLIYIFGILYACARSCLRAQADSCIHIARVSLALLFQK